MTRGGCGGRLFGERSGEKMFSCENIQATARRVQNVKQVSELMFISNGKKGMFCDKGISRRTPVGQKWLLSE